MKNAFIGCNITINIHITVQKETAILANLSFQHTDQMMTKTEERFIPKDHQ